MWKCAFFTQIKPMKMSPSLLTNCWKCVLLFGRVHTVTKIKSTNTHSSLLIVSGKIIRRRYDTFSLKISIWLLAIISFITNVCAFYSVMNEIIASSHAVCSCLLWAIFSTVVFNSSYILRNNIRFCFCCII